MVRTPVEASLLGVDDMTYGEFVSGLEQPTLFNVLKGESLDGHFILELNPAIVFPIIDRLLGGGGAPGQTVLRRPFTEIELRLASRTTELAIAAVRKAWTGLCELVLRTVQVECNPQLASIICFASREAYYQKGRWCGCPDDKARNGRLCGSYSANSRTGRPCCDVGEVTQKQIDRYRAMFGRKT